MSFDESDIARCLAVLRAIAEDRGELSRLDPETRRELLSHAATLLSPDRVERRRLAKAFRKKDRRIVREADTRLLDQTGMRKDRRTPVFETPRPALEAPHSASSPEPLKTPRSCYVCKAKYRELHFFYDSMCPGCAQFNWEKRNQSVPLDGRVALVTGARVKIG